MRDIPVFTTSNGVASLYFKKIPYTKEAFVQVRSSISCEALLKECVDVCRMAGAERVLATGHEDLKGYRMYCSVVAYRVAKTALADTEAFALPLIDTQALWWRRVYNQKMASVPTAAPLSEAEVDALIREKKAYCIYRDCAAIGIGVAYDGQIHAIASASPGGGRDSVLALANVLDEPIISLSVASTNKRAMYLYWSLGFRELGEEAAWYQIF